MKTPMQELIEQLKEERDLHGYERGLHYETAIELAESMLEKEKKVMCEFAFRFDHYAFTDNYIKAVFEKTFKTKERWLK